jgi:hypothetical protein
MKPGPYVCRVVGGTQYNPEDRLTAVRRRTKGGGQVARSSRVGRRLEDQERPGNRLPLLRGMSESGVPDLVNAYGRKC